MQSRKVVVDCGLDSRTRWFTSLNVCGAETDDIVTLIKAAVNGGGWKPVYVGDEGLGFWRAKGKLSCGLTVGAEDKVEGYSLAATGRGWRVEFLCQTAFEFREMMGDAKEAHWEGVVCTRYGMKHRVLTLVNMKGEAAFRRDMTIVQMFKDEMEEFW